MSALQTTRLDEPSADDQSVSVVFGQDTSFMPDGSVLYLKDMEPDQVGNIVIQALQNDCISIIADSAPVATGQLALTSAEYGPSFIQFESVRIISDAELNVIIMPDG